MPAGILAWVIASPPHGTFATGTNLARYRLLQIAAQILHDLLLTLLNFEQDRLRHSSVVLTRMYLSRLQEDSPQVADALLREQHLVVGLDHGSSSSTIPRFRKLLDVW